jgi:hypothetical protein
MRFRHRILGAALRRAPLALAATLVAAGAAQATTVQRLSLPAMVERAQEISHARVLENRVWTDPDTLHHWTVTTFEVLEAAKGPMRPGEIFDIEVLGGEAPGSGYATVVADAPRFTLGEEVVLFTYRSADGRRHPVGFFQGAVRLRSGPDGLETVGRPADLAPGLRPAPTTAAAPLRPAGRPAAPAAGAPAAAPARGAAARPDTAGGRRALPVADLLEQVRAIDARLQEERP